MALLSGGPGLGNYKNSGGNIDDQESDVTGRNMTPASLVQIPIPSEFVEEETRKASVLAAGEVVTFQYKALVHYLLQPQFDVLPIALYRVGVLSRERVSKNLGSTSVPERSYVVTNPPQDTICNENDRVFCLVHSRSVWQLLKSEHGPIQRSDPPSKTAESHLEAQVKAEKLRGDVLERQISTLQRQLEMLASKAGSS